jgi:hypothetical protein
MPEGRRSPSLAGVVLCAAGRVALPVSGAPAWRERDGYTFVPAGLPGGPAAASEAPAAAALRLARAAFGPAATLRASARVYGPSAEHAIDVLPADAEDEPHPLLRLVRLLPADDDTPAPRTAVLRAYLATLDGPIALAPADAGVLWLAPRALRNALRGMPLAELLAQPGARWESHGDEARLPEDAFIFIPGEYGERHLVRIAAKYGGDALFQEDPDHGEEGRDGDGA